MVQPTDLGPILTHYEEQHGCSKGLICISSSKNPSLAAYKAAIESADFSHKVTHVFILSADNPPDEDKRHLMFIDGVTSRMLLRYNPIAQPNVVGVVPRNGLAAQVRQVIGLI